MDTYGVRQSRTDRPEVIEAMLTMREACQLLNVHQNTLRRWGAVGLVKEYRIGMAHQRRFSAGDIAALAVEQMTFATAVSKKRSRIKAATG
ncbi:MAG: helix-turn-helix domain-containing protein [Dehalococcoidia bacterium]